jgi:hypothetical protein
MTTRYEACINCLTESCDAHVECVTIIDFDCSKGMHVRVALMGNENKVPETIFNLIRLNLARVGPKVL